MVSLEMAKNNLINFIIFAKKISNLIKLSNNEGNVCQICGKTREVLYIKLTDNMISINSNRGLIFQFISFPKYFS